MELFVLYSCIAIGVGGTVRPVLLPALCRPDEGEPGSQVRGELSGRGQRRLGMAFPRRSRHAWVFWFFVLCTIADACWRSASSPACWCSARAMCV